MASPVALLDLREKQVKLDHLNVNFLKGPRVHWKYDIGTANRPQTFCLHLPIFLLIGEVKWGRKYPGIMSGCLIETYIIGSQRRSDKMWEWGGQWRQAERKASVLPSSIPVGGYLQSA